MKYGIIKSKLLEKGFTLEYIQTSCELDLLQFQHPTIKGGINVDFVRKPKIPKDVLKGREFSYDEKWVEDIDVQSIEFDIDISISFMSDNVIDTCGDSEENKIYLNKLDLHRFDYILDLVCNPMSYLDFHQTYSAEVSKFITEIKRFLPIIEKYKLPHTITKRCGDITTMYPSFSIEYYESDYRTIDFYFEVLTWKKEIAMNLEGGYVPKTGKFKMNSSLKSFEKELERQLKYNADLVEYQEKKNFVDAKNKEYESKAL